ncbi:MAG TPA: 50S ribosomal protein L23 [Acidimicrobiia bacterium]|jgi:large subunit ribosomal protein L23|nr:50S ribosomal protein L23 [Acidimicrobiia bacterium]
MRDLRDVILAPVVSEKSYDLIEHNNTYTFMVDPRCNKSEIKSAVEQVFGVRVVRVNTMNRKGKLKRQGWKMGRRKNTKRALVTLATGNSIDVFGV